ncbi:hypothetical protein Csac_0805 [Caldicellulosiruptor saccharolyticus DSM 8903]|uniref:Single Cache domain-containing protein n=1 Tax=Caldicellulosiruptor saccharolyticus (strain ATCC 43494 / DSM 8903 / Tp8T 6331) TaxID=351627 RepID=A4XHN9_CALS8|nr:cache domain-containing protein [Caldicellulosiruptor saccharolyticus]ABP66424.1 hypothetical protein Csac_0805 [Caldicellulosiruptor saccharolyticus DSM 8903]
MGKNSIKWTIALTFIGIILISTTVLEFIAYNISKKALTNLGIAALKNKVNMGIAFMEVLETQVQKGKLSREEAQEIFRSKMLNIRLESK